MGKIQEQRKFVRREQPYITKFRVKPNDDKVTKNWDAVSMFDLSSDSIFFYSRTNLEVGTILDLKIGFSYYYPTIICVGKVIRMTKHPATSINGYSVELTEIDEQIRKMINKNLEITELHQKLK